MLVLQGHTDQEAKMNKLADLYAALAAANTAQDMPAAKAAVAAIRRHPEYRARTRRPVIATRRNSR